MMLPMKKYTDVTICPDCGGEVKYYHEYGGITRVVCKDNCQGYKAISVIDRNPIQEVE